MIKQQGDVLFKKISKVKGKKKNGEYVLAVGEATGHSHQVAIEGRKDVEIYERDGTLYLRIIGEEATIVHEEHLPLTLTRGDYEVGRVREYNHFAEEAMNVKD